MKKNTLFIILSFVLLTGCKTVKDLEKTNSYEEVKTAASLEEEEIQIEEENGEFLVMEELKVQDVEKTVVYVVSYTQINDENEIDYAAVEKVFFSKTAAEEYKAKREAETWGADYSVDEMEVE